MTAENYLRQLLATQSVDTGPNSPVRKVAVQMVPILRGWAGGQLLDIRPSGSFAKGTANLSGTDLDLFISLSETTTNSLKEIYNSLASAMEEAGYKPKLQNVSINVKVNGYDVDLVPGKRQNALSSDHSLYRRRADTWTKTNVDEHIDIVRQSGRTEECRILKLWRNQKGLEFPSFYLELTVIEALKGTAIPSLDRRVWRLFEYLRDKFGNARVADPANTANIISDDLTDRERERIRLAAIAALNARDWKEIVL